MKYSLINIGRGKINRVVDAKDYGALLKEVKRHLMSQDVEVSFDDQGIGTVFAGIHAVGKVEPLLKIAL